MIAAVLQARMSSARLPGKVLKPILGQPMICRQLERIRQAKHLDSIIVATSEQASDDPIVAAVDALDIGCFRGSLDDVLDRFYRAAASNRADHIVRLTGDCPLVDAQIVDEVIEKHLSEGRDYTSNFLERRYPDGIDVEVFTFQALEQAWQEAELTTDREHVTPFIYRQPERFSLGSLRCDQDLAALRWTVDHPEDLEFVTKVFEALYPDSGIFSMWNVLELLEHRPELAQINAARREYPS